MKKTNLHYLLEDNIPVPHRRSKKRSEIDQNHAHHHQLKERTEKNLNLDHGLQRRQNIGENDAIHHQTPQVVHQNLRVQEIDDDVEGVFLIHLETEEDDKSIVTSG